MTKALVIGAHGYVGCLVALAGLGLKVHGGTRRREALKVSEGSAVPPFVMGTQSESLFGQRAREFDLVVIASGGFGRAVAGEANFRAIAHSAVKVCAWPVASFRDLVSVAGGEWVNLGLVVNCRTQTRRSRRELGRSPMHQNLIGDIRQGAYAQAWKQHAYSAA